MTLSDLSIKNPVFAWMLMAGLMLFGWIGFRSMGISQLPDIDFPMVTVNLTWEGAAPEVMETEVTDPIEDAVMQVQGVKEVSSSSRQGNAMVSIEFELGRDIDAALQEVQTKISQAQRNLPEDMDPPVITKTNPEDQPIMWVALSGDRDLRFIMEYARDHLKNEFTTVPGVGEVMMGGYVEPNLRVWLDLDKLEKKELTVEDVKDAIESEHSEVPAGFIDTGARELNVRVMGEAANVEEFRRIVIPERNGRPIWARFRIGDVAEVEEGLADVRRISRVGGQPALGLGIKKQRGANAVAVARAVKAKMEDVRKRLPQGLAIGVNFDGTRFIEESTRDLEHELVMAALLTAIVCWLFLGSISSAINIILAIPVSMLGSFIVLNFLGFTLNTFTLLGLTLVIGVVVDDAIMVLENIVRYKEMGHSKVKASILGAREITSAATAATVSILAIFVPVVFMKGIVGKFLFQFGVTISVAVAISLLEALTLAPMRTSQFLAVGHDSWLGSRIDRGVHLVTNAYRSILRWCLGHRWIVIAGALGIFIGSMFLTTLIKKEFVPAQDQSMLLVQLRTPVGSSIEFTDKVFREAEAYVMARPEVDRYYAAIGGFTGGEVDTGIMFITMKTPDKRPVDPQAGHPLSQQEFIGVMREGMNKLKGVQRAFIQDLSLSGFTSQGRGFPVEFTLLGRDWDKMGELAGELQQKMTDSGLMVDVDSDYRLGAPEVRVLPNREKAAARGVSVETIGTTINATIGGVRVGKYSKGGRRYDVRLQLTEPDRKQPQDINKIWVRNNRGEVIRLNEVVDVVEKPTLRSITRKNRERAISIFSNVAPGHSQGEAIAYVEQLAKSLPEGYRIKLSGSAQTMQESGLSLLIALVLGIVVAYMVLGSQYNSFIHPITVLLALPFSMTGAFLALWIAGKTINLYSMIGVILLMGIVKKNSILLVDFTNERRKAGLPVFDALMEACPIRLRPIVMTSIATVSAAIPTAIGLGAGAESRVPMALVIIGGVSVSTLLTLFVVPCAYSLMSRLESRKHDRDLREALVELGELKADAVEPPKQNPVRN